MICGRFGFKSIATMAPVLYMGGSKLFVGVSVLGGG